MKESQFHWILRIFIFEQTAEAAKRNSAILQKFKYDYAKVVESCSNTILTPGSEFRPVTELNSIWKHNRDWTKVKKILSEGIDYPCVKYPT